MYMWMNVVCVVLPSGTLSTQTVHVSFFQLRDLQANDREEIRVRHSLVLTVIFKPHRRRGEEAYQIYVSHTNYADS